jgi:hypothetical protein
MRNTDSGGADVEKLTIIVFAGLLAYICFVLTSINAKLDELNASGAQVAVLNEVKPQSYSADEPRDVGYQYSAPAGAEQMNAGYVIAAFIAIFVSWHVSRLYHTHQWTKRILRKTFASYSEPHVMPARREPLHLDQDCVGDPPLPDGRLKESWLPGNARALYAGWGGRTGFVE